MIHVISSRSLLHRRGTYYQNMFVLTARCTVPHPKLFASWFTFLLINNIWTGSSQFESGFNNEHSDEFLKFHVFFSIEPIALVVVLHCMGAILFASSSVCFPLYARISSHQKLNVLLSSSARPKFFLLRVIFLGLQGSTSPVCYFIFWPSWFQC